MKPMAVEHVRLVAGICFQADAAAPAN